MVHPPGKTANDIAAGAATKAVAGQNINRPFLQIHLLPGETRHLMRADARVKHHAHRRRAASPSQRFINLRVKYRKSYTILVRLSFLASSAAVTACSKLMAISCCFNVSAPTVMNCMARFMQPGPS